LLKLNSYYDYIFIKPSKEIQEVNKTVMSVLL